MKEQIVQIKNKFGRIVNVTLNRATKMVARNEAVILTNGVKDLTKLNEPKGLIKKSEAQALKEAVEANVETIVPTEETKKKTK